ncbi:helix-turn-helix domain-containing protein [Lentibacter sp.]|uniref:helix-turn-helix domain-containing protein n=1 Tax=Lentibacter sp. TaxID=2024994 RepID=UPI003F6D3285
MSEEMTKDWFDPETSTFGDRVAGAREAAGMTQKQLAKRLGVKLVTLRNWENDMAEPRANKLSMLAGLLNVSMMWLLDGTGEGVDPVQDVSREEKDMNEILAEIVDLKSRALRTANRLGALEKKLRTWVD